MEEGAQLSALVSEAVCSKIQQHRQQEQQQVDALLASQKHLTSNLRTLINSLDTILQLSTPRYSNSQGDLVSSCANRAKALGHKLDTVAARLARIQEHLDQEEAKYGLVAPQHNTEPDAAAAAEAEAGCGVGDGQQHEPRQQPEKQEQPQEPQQEQQAG